MTAVAGTIMVPLAISTRRHQMRRQFVRSQFVRLQFVRLMALFAVLLALVAPAAAQSPASDSEIAARELIATMKLSDQFTLMLPMVFKAMKPAIVQNRPDVDRDFDALVPVLQQKMAARINELMEAVVVIYSSNFSAQELRDLIAFYKTPTGQKLLQKTPALTQQTMIAGQKFGQSAGAEAQKEMIEQLRNKGHAL
jgi:hypothetical protein